MGKEGDKEQQMQRAQQLPRQFTALQLRSIEDTVHFLV